jgi:hypothetical protein
MDWQEIMSFIIVATAAALILRSEIHKHKLRKTRLCGGDCKCSPLKAVLLKQIKTK